MESLKGRFLLASRRLADPNFFHAVVLMIQHGEDGALGVVLNRPLEVTIKEACDDTLELSCQTEGVLHQGGPCQGPLMALHADRAAAGAGHGGPGSYGEVLSGVYFSTERDELECLLTQSHPKAKFFVGYAGWGEGQLESELESGSWLVTPATADRVFNPGPGELWSKLILHVTLGGGINADLIPDDPSVN